jgi:hypothetical protein
MTEEQVVELYWDDELGKFISTHSMLKTFRRCPKQFEYKYVERLKPRILGRPLRAGTWMHKLQEVHYAGGDWEAEHQRMTYRFNELFDEEKSEIGDLPNDCHRMFQSYLWHYATDDWKVLETEFTIEVELPDGTLFRCKVDLLIEDQYGLWVVDHKWHKTLPTHEYRILDSQSADYIWACHKAGIPVQGHIWNYGRSKPPTIPELIKSGKRISRWSNIDTDFPTAMRFFRDHPEIDKRPYLAKLRRLKAAQYRFGEMQTSTYLKRVVVEKNAQMINRSAREMFHTHQRMHDYPWHRTNMVERVPDRSCIFMCSFTDICSAELVTGKRPVNWRQRYEIGDPLDYYQDDRNDFGKEVM